MRDVTWALAALMIGAVPSALAAQTAPVSPAKPLASKAKATPAPAPAEDDEEAIVVTGRRQPGAVVGDIPPEVQLTPNDVRAYGVSTITELLDELSPQTASGRGRGGERPVVLLDGQRISGFQEIRDIPTEAILRVDILPEEVALKYGYSANQKVVNFVLRKRFRAITGELTGGLSTRGDGESGKAEADLLHIRNGQRLNVDVTYQTSAELKESQRDIVSSAQGRPYDFVGNVTAPVQGAEIDPALNALAGTSVTLAGVPASAGMGRPALGAFVPGANNANASDLSRDRTFRPATDALTVNAVLARTIFGNVGASLNGSFGATGSDSLRGLPGISLLAPAGSAFSPFSRDVTIYRYAAGQSPLTQDTAGETAHLGGNMNGSLGKFAWSLTGNYDHSDSRTDTETGVDISALQGAVSVGSINPFGAIPASLVGARTSDHARSIGNSGNLEFAIRGVVAHLPAGDVNTSLRFSGSFAAISSSSTRAGLFADTSLSRRDGGGQVNIDIPLTSARNDVLPALGDLSVNFNATGDRLSDFGTLATYGYGSTWKPTRKLTLLYSFTREEGAPTVQQLGNPQVLTPDVRIFDFVRGTTVDVAQLDGGNAALRSDTRRVTKIGATWKPLTSADLTLTANYVSSSIRNAIATLPAPTAALQTAFPDRFLRDSDGDLVRVDNRAVNFASEDRRQLRWGFNFSKPLKQTNAKQLFDKFRELRAEGKGRDVARMFGRDGRGGDPRRDRPPQDGAVPPPAAEGATPPSPPPGDGGPPPGGPGGSGPGGGFGGGGPGGPGGGGRGGFGRRDPNTGRLQFAVYHTWYFRDDILIRPGVPVLDLLHGAQSGGTGGQPQHEVEVQAGYSNNGIGARLTGKYQSPTTVDGGTALAGDDLRFSSLSTLNFRLFANLGQIPSLVKNGWARGARVTFSINNLLDTHIHVRDATGATPLSYQAAYLDPVGRSVSLSIRKLFF